MRIGGEGYMPGAPQSREPAPSKETRQFGDKKPGPPLPGDKKPGPPLPGDKKPGPPLPGDKKPGPPLPSDKESAPLPEEGVGRRVSTEGAKGGSLPNAPLSSSRDQAQKIQDLIAQGADPNEILEELEILEKSLQAEGKEESFLVTMLMGRIHNAMAENDGGKALAKALETTNERLSDLIDNG